MDALSFVITLLSVVMAVGMAVIAARVLRDEHRRSEARVAALSRMAGSAQVSASNDTAADFLPEAEPEPLFAGAVEPMGTEAGLFAAPQHASPWGLRMAIAAGVATVLLTVAGIGMLRTGSAARPGAAATARADAAPLELLALHDTAEAGRLTVSGRVQNPRGAAPVPALTATVFLFGADGAFLTSGRAPLDAAALAGGGESAFAVTIPVNGPVARYRVSFRDSTGRAVAHVDRRETRSARAPSPGRLP